MPVESWMTPEETAALAAQATSLIDASLNRLTAEERDAFWASVRKCYNTPYNDPKPRALPRLLTAEVPKAERARAEMSSPDLRRSDTPQVEMSMAAIPVPAAFGRDTHAA